MNYLAIGNDELKNRPEVHDGDMITCPRCGRTHALYAAKDDKGEKDETILAYKCGGVVCLAAVNCKLLPKIERAIQ